jgi:tRNA U34 5-carboxymethylaminomethyl modifying GTPase MnmE/TrmE
MALDHTATETIVAVSTPPGRGGIGIVRLSGPEALSIAATMLSQTPTFEHARARLVRLVDEHGILLDEAVVTAFHAPRSFTGEHVLEIAAHGSPVVLDELIRRALQQGARLAEAGEFARRAFLNGRLDLTQAEAIHDLIAAQTLAQARTAAQQMGGALSRRIAPVKQQLVHLIALMEAGMDFASGELDDVDTLPIQAIAARLEEIRIPLTALADSYRHGSLERNGLRLALVGRPNAGKSSLFNRLLGRERAIVTAAPGTTRDTLEETLALDGIPLRLVDTAGLRNEGLSTPDLSTADLNTADPGTPSLNTASLSNIALSTAYLSNIALSTAALSTADVSTAAVSDEPAETPQPTHSPRLSAPQRPPRSSFSESEHISEAETLGIVRSREALADADVILLIEDATAPDDAHRAEVLRSLAGRPVLLIRNKIDLLPAPHAASSRTGGSAAEAASTCNTSAAAEQPSEEKETASAAAEPAPLPTSALTGEGLDTLRAALLQLVRGPGASADEAALNNLRQKQAVDQALHALAAAATANLNGLPHEVTLIDLHAALDALDTLTGETTTDEILALIFSTFCIGK